MDNFIHTAVVSREGATISSGQTVFGGFSQVFAALKCLIEPLPAWRQVSVIGLFGGRAFSVTWGNESLREGDRFLWNGRTFTFKLNADDQYRGDSGVPPYQTGMLLEDTIPRG